MMVRDKKCGRNDRSQKENVELSKARVSDRGRRNPDLRSRRDSPLSGGELKRKNFHTFQISSLLNTIFNSQQYQL